MVKTTREIASADGIPFTWDAEFKHIAALGAAEASRTRRRGPSTDEAVNLSGMTADLKRVPGFETRPHFRLLREVPGG